MTYEDRTECSETLAHKIQMLENHPKDRIQHSWHGERFFWATLRGLNFMCQRFRTLYSIFISGVSRKNNWNKFARVFIQAKLWLKKNLSQLEGGGGGGAYPSKGIVCGGQTHQEEACSRYGREKCPCVRARKGRHGMVVMELLCFRRLYS